MNKKLVAAAVAAACVAGAPAVQAEATVYANVQFEIVDTDVDGSDSTTRVDDNERGRIGIKGGHDLGGGLKSWAIAEFDFVGGDDDAEFGDASDTDSNGDTVTVRGNALRVREIAVGLKGSFGSIGIGTVKSAYKYNGGIKYDPFVTTNIEARSGRGMSGGTQGHHGFLNDAIIYTNKFGMANLHITYSPDDADTDGDSLTDDGQTSAALKFGNKTWEAGIALFDEGQSGTGSIEATKFFGKMKFGQHTVLAQYEDVDAGSGANNSTEYLWLGYHMKVGKGLFVVNYATVDPDGAANDRDMLLIAYKHAFNKKTKIWAGFQSQDFDAANSDTDRLSVGIRVDI